MALQRENERKREQLRQMKYYIEVEQSKSVD